ncbi:MAG: efflux RND transporter periplasmic adaptor subunit [Gemmatimonadaceae bacterium]|nr:efflux RND transporter periplasmic adaptor subunit [Gemmatimonadaceae bacterium]MCC6432507.1 efflux RND transporter periplasmic adaptor subunit [Gemmatimonadaceae bacterium]
MMNTMRPTAPMLTTAIAVAAALVLGACNKKTEAADTTAAAVQMIGPDNIAVATTDTLRSGPAISGTLIADREARIRAEISGAVLQLYVDAGQRVETGTVLARIDDAVLQDAVLSARSGVTQATVSADQAARELKRAQTLVAAGAIAERDVEGAERANLSAQAQLADAKARLSTVEKNLRSATVRAPFGGIVAEKSVSAGDIVAPGAALFTVIDPRSLRVEGSVPTSALGQVKVGAPVLFTVNGSDRELEGRITRVSPMVDAQTKQVKILASVPNAQNALVAGLFVEGRVATDKRVAVLVPEQAVDQTGVSPIVMRLKAGKVERVDVQIGLRDEGAAKLEVRSGLATGDTVLLGAARGISVGSSVAVSAPKDAPAAPVKNN